MPQKSARRCLPLLTVVLAAAHAGDPPTQPPTTPPVTPAEPGRVMPQPRVTNDISALGNGGIIGAKGELTPGRGSDNASRQVVLRGFFDSYLERRFNTTDANDEKKDARTNAQMRAKLDFEIKTDDHVKFGLGLGWHGASGNRAVSPEFGPANNGSGVAAGDNGQLLVQRADVVITSFMGFDSAGILLGRSSFSTPISSGRRKDASLLFDSRANDRDQTGWDGMRVDYSGLETVKLKAGAYRLPDQSSLMYGRFEWKPMESGDDRMFLAGSYNRQQDVPVSAASTLRAASLTSYYVGASWNWGATELFAEGAAQRGEITKDRKIDAWGMSSGVDWTWYTPNKIGLGLGFDWLSGNGGGSSGRYTGFINPYETSADTYLFEDESHGELLRRVDAGVQAFKSRFGYAFDRQNRIGIDIVLAAYRTAEDDANGNRDLGKELDLTLRWNYEPATTLKFYTAALRPGQALDTLLGAGDKGDMIYIFGMGLKTTF